MDIRLRALLRSLGILAMGFVGSGLTVLFFKYFPSDYVPHLFIAGLLGMLIYLGYSISLSQLQAEETLKNLQEKR